MPLLIVYLLPCSWFPGGFCLPDTSGTDWEERTEGGKEEPARKRLQQKRIVIGNAGRIGRIIYSREREGSEEETLSNHPH